MTPLIQKIVRMTIVTVSCVSLCVAPFAFAVDLTDTTYKMSNYTASAYANHTITFRTPSGMSSGVITINLSNLISNINSLTYQDIDLMYGSTQATLAAAAGVGVWGATVNESSKVLTLTYPVSGGTAISAGVMVLIKIGGHAVYQSSGSRRLVNATTVGSKDIAITAGQDSLTVSATVATQTATTSQMINGSVGSGVGVSIAAGSDTVQVGVALVNDDSITATSSVQTRGVVVGGGIFAPTDLAVSQYTPTRLQLDWTDNSGIETGYIIERREIRQGDATSFLEVGVTGSNISRFRDEGLSPETTYEYRVRAYNPYFLSSYSNTSIETTAKQTYVNTPFVGGASGGSGSSGGGSGATQSVSSPQAIQSETPTPATVTSLAGEAGDGVATLKWINPIDTTVIASQIQWSDSVFPRTPDEGITVYKELGNEFIDKGLQNGAPSFYTIFTLNSFGKYSVGAYVMVIPLQPERPLAKPIPLIIPQGSESVPQLSSGISTKPSQRQKEPLPIVEVTLSPTRTADFAPTQEAIVSVTSPHTLGGSVALSVQVPPQTFSDKYEISISPRTVEQARQLDSALLFPDGRTPLAGALYQVQVTEGQENIKQFEKPVTLSFTYDSKIAEYYDEKTLVVHYWNPLVRAWTPIRSVVDLTHKKITATVNHFTLFTVLGHLQPDVKKDVRTAIPFVIQTTTSLDLPKAASIPLANIFTSQSLASEKGRTVTVESAHPLALCLEKKLFGQSISAVSVLVADTQRYLLTYDPIKECFAGALTAPQKLGQFPMEIAVIFNNDFVQKESITLQVIAPQIVGVTQIAAPRIILWPYIVLAAIALYLCIVAFMLVVHDMYFLTKRARRETT